jgi:hypothetical protein
MSLAEKLRTLVTSQVVKERCITFSEKIHPEQALEDTCEIIERFSRD